ncbi:hypothetical protein LA080_004599 [Diaporthe eres]|nr:hypothetical protein LA080_004599 [Diaporthe eres]
MRAKPHTEVWVHPFSLYIQVLHPYLNTTPLPKGVRHRFWTRTVEKIPILLESDYACEGNGVLSNPGPRTNSRSKTPRGHPTARKQLSHPLEDRRLVETLLLDCKLRGAGMNSHQLSQFYRYNDLRPSPLSFKSSRLRWSGRDMELLICALRCAEGGFPKRCRLDLSRKVDLRQHD